MLIIRYIHFMPSSRSFTIVHVAKGDGCPTKFAYGNESGKFIGSNPRGAASKALTKMCEHKRIHGQCSMYITIRETTRGSAQKTYTYLAKRKKSVRTERINGREIHFRWQTILKSMRGRGARKCTGKNHRMSPGPRFKSSLNRKKSEHRERRSRSRSRSGK